MSVQKILIPNNNRYCHHFRAESTLKEIISPGSPLLQHYNLRAKDEAIKRRQRTYFMSQFFLCISVKMLPSLFSASKKIILKHFLRLSVLGTLSAKMIWDLASPTRGPGSWVFPPVHLQQPQQEAQPSVAGPRSRT